MRGRKSYSGFHQSMRNTKEKKGITIEEEEEKKIKK